VLLGDDGGGEGGTGEVVEEGVGKGWWRLRDGFHTVIVWISSGLASGKRLNACMTAI